MIEIENIRHATLWEFINENEGEEFRPNSIDLMPFHQAIVAIIKHLYQNDKIAIKLPEFDEASYNYNIGFSAELQKIVHFEASRYFNFSDVFFGYVEIRGISTQKIDFAEKRTSAQELEIGVLDKYIQDLPEHLIINLNRSFWYSRILWARRLNELIYEREYTCYSELTFGEFGENSAHKFGNELSVHYTGLLIQKSITDNVETSNDIGVLLLYAPLDGDEEKSADYKLAVEWVLEQHKKHQLHPPVAKGQTKNQRNFIDFAYKILKNPATSTFGKSLEITNDDLKSIWDNDLPQPSECKWKSKGNKPKQ